MAVSENAQRHHDALFGGGSSLAQTDPELMEVFDNVAFEDVLTDSDLDLRTRPMVQLASTIASQALAGVELPLPGRSTTTRDTRHDVGLAFQKQIVGSDRVDAMYANAPADEQHFQRYPSAHCFGDHVGRSGIDLAP